MYEIKKEIDNGDGTGTLVLGDYIEPACATSCLICGKTIIGYFHFGVEICGECRQAVLWAKKKMKEEHNEQI